MEVQQQKLSTELTDKRADIEDFRAKQQQEIIARLKAEITDLEDQKSVVEDALKVIEEEENILSTEVANAEDRVMDLDAQAKELKKEIPHLKKEVKELVAIEATMVEHITQLKGSSTDVEAQIADKKLNLLALDTDIIQKTTEMDDILADYDTKLTNQKNAYKEILRKTEDAVAQLQKFSDTETTARTDLVQRTQALDKREEVVTRRELQFEDERKAVTEYRKYMNL